MTWGWVTEERIFFLGWTNSLNTNNQVGYDEEHFLLLCSFKMFSKGKCQLSKHYYIRLNCSIDSHMSEYYILSNVTWTVCLSHKPRSSATGWECWVWVSVHTPLSSYHPLMGLIAPGHNKATGNLHKSLQRTKHPWECIEKYYRKKMWVRMCG